MPTNSTDQYDIPTSPDEAMDKGVSAADPGQAKEYADVKAWEKRIFSARSYDAPARSNYVRLRRYARGDSGFKVDANIVGTNIDILEAFIYAKNPDVDILPGKAVEVPSAELLADAALLAAEEDPSIQAQVQQAQQAASWQALAQGLNPIVVGMEAAKAAKQALVQMKAEENLAKMQAEFRRRQQEAKQFAETSELIVARLWQDARLKDRGRPWVRSGLTLGTGWLKATWQGRSEVSPQAQTAINDLVANLDRAKLLQAELMDPNSQGDAEAKAAELMRQIHAVTASVEQAEAAGFVVDLVDAQNIQTAPGRRLADYRDGPWMAERIPMDYEEAKATFDLPDEKWAKAVKYYARPPEMHKDESANLTDRREVSPAEADQFVRGEAPDSPNNPDDATGAGWGCFVMVWEIWDRRSNHVLTWVEGLQCWARPAWVPPATSRFYPYFGWFTSEVDGERHPQSPVDRSSKLVDEYNRIGSAEAEHRRRIVPKTLFDASTMADTEADKLARATTQEMVPVKFTRPGTNPQQVFFPVTYAALDPALYDRQRIMNEIERIWGVQEALSGSVQTAKTATEAEIQQSGFMARTSSRRDSVESVLQELAVYTLELARRYMTDEQVREIAGPGAFWPPYEGPDDLRKMVTIEIRAGSTGKPNTSAERESWGALLPILQNGIMQVGQLRNSQPADMAKSVEALLRLTAERAGDRVDIEALLPAAGPAPMMPGMGVPGDPMAAPAPGEPLPAVPAEPGAPPVDQGAT